MHRKVGITGTSASGKGTAAGHLADKGFLHVDTGEVVREEAMRLYGSDDQYLLRKAGHELRQRLGGGAIVLAALEQYDAQSSDFEGVVISGIRAIAPAQTLKNNDGLLVFVDAPIETRYRNQTERGRAGESKNLAEFVKFEEDELAGMLETGQDLRGVQGICDIEVYNDRDIPALLEAIDSAVGLTEG